MPTEIVCFGIQVVVASSEGNREIYLQAGGPSVLLRKLYALLYSEGYNNIYYVDVRYVCSVDIPNRDIDISILSATLLIIILVIHVMKFMSLSFTQCFA